MSIHKMLITSLKNWGLAQNSRHFCYNKTNLGEPQVCADRGICLEWNIALDFGKQRRDIHIECSKQFK